MLRLGGREQSLRSRRAIVKTRLVRLGAKGLAAARAHLRYLERDGTSRDGEPGMLYSGAEDRADGKAFLERGGGDRHQFRVIVSAEDEAQYDDLKPLVRRFMARLEEDLGTRLDWVAIDHFDTLHPHTHIMLRGKDDQGQNLIIAPDYIRHGMRERLAALVSIDLGPRTDLEIRQHLHHEVEAERLTSIDRCLIRQLDGDRTLFAGGRDMAEHSRMAGRLNKLAALGLAERMGNGRWKLDEELEPMLRRLGERGDIVRTMQRALTAAGKERAAADRVIFSSTDSGELVGTIVARGLSDDLRDRHYLIVDGIDGRAHYVEIGKADDAEPLPDRAIVRIVARASGPSDTDRRIAEIGQTNDGRYDVGLHLAADPAATVPFVEAHVRRLEAIRRVTGDVERDPDGRWSVPKDFLDLAARYELSRAHERPVEIEILSSVPLDRLSDHDGATWLDRQLAGERIHLRDAGFGHEVRSALDSRRAWLVGQGLATGEGGDVQARPGFLALLEQREIILAGERLSGETGLLFAIPEEGARLEGIVRRRLDLASGRYAMIESGHEFALVPWRPVLARAIGREVSGRARRDGTISWTIARDRGIEI